MLSGLPKPVVVIVGPVVLALVVVVMFEPTVIAGPMVMALVAVVMFQPAMVVGAVLMALCGGGDSRDNMCVLYMCRY